MYKTDPNRWPKYLLLSFIYKAVLKSSTTTAEEKQHIQIVIYFLTPLLRIIVAILIIPLLMLHYLHIAFRNDQIREENLLLLKMLYLHITFEKSFFRFQIKLELWIEFLGLNDGAAYYIYISRYEYVGHLNSNIVYLQKYTHIVCSIFF